MSRLTSGDFGITSPAMEPLFTRESLFCVLLLGVCLLATWPVAEIGIIDDWSYVRTTQIFAYTGHFAYNGWATTILGWQVVWGALFARVFGSSYTAIRSSIFPIDLATALLYHVILRRFGVNKSHATLATLTVVLSPLFLPLATTFMSDVPGFFPIVLCLYLCQLAVAAPSDSAARGWLIPAALTNIALGTVRQTAWLGVLVMVPSCAWILRRRRFVVALTAGLWLMGVVCVLLTVRWFLRQPYSVPERLVTAALDLSALQRLFEHWLQAAMTTALLCLPVLAMGLAVLFPLRRRTALRGALLAVVFVAVVVVLKYHHRSGVLALPWMGTTINYVGIQSLLESLSPRSVPTAGELVFLFCCLACVWAFLEMPDRPVVHQVSERARIHWRSASVLMLPLLVSYCLLLVPRSAGWYLYDRYLVPIVAVVLMYLVGWHQERVSVRVPAIATVVLVLFAWGSVATTHDVFALERARVTAIDELQRAGIPRTAIRGGYPFDAITQIDAWGYVNEPALVNPPGAYHPRPRDTGPCAYWFNHYIPAVHARYAVETGPNLCVTPSAFPPVAYRTWFMPGTRYVWVGTLPGSGA